MKPCKFCKSEKTVKAGIAYGAKGKPSQRLLCNKCKRYFIIK